VEREKKIMTPEAKVKKKVKAAFEKLGALYVPVITGGMGRGGTADALVCWRGLFVAVEVKATAKGKMTALQELFERDTKAAGGLHLLISGDTFLNDENLERILRHWLMNHKNNVVCWLNNWEAKGNPTK
jgi:hypothetical protein